MVYVLTGASGSGKSEYAERLVCRLARERGITEKIYLATMERSLGNAARIARHRRQRAGRGFRTVEAPFGPADGVLGTGRERVILLECMSNLLANLVFSGGMPFGEARETILSRIGELTEQCLDLVIVTNEIFSDGNRYDGETAAYIRTLGEINCRLAAAADEFYEIVYSVPLCLKGERLPKKE